MALRPPAAALEELRRAATPLHRALPGLRWTDPQDQHLTLHFLGEVAESRLARLDAPALRAAARSTAPALRFCGVGQFPQDSRRARVLWAGVAGESAALHRLHAELATALVEGGLAPEDRPYVPHLTLARARGRPLELGTAPVQSALAPLRDFSGATWRADQVELLGSTPGSVPRYPVLAAWPLHWDQQNG